MPKPANFEIVVGTYEEYLLGYFFSSQEKNLIQSVASHDHSGSVRALTTCEHYLASGATDDRIIVYDLKTRKEHCMLTHHESTISCLAFTNSHSHIISAAQDGSLAIVRVGNWLLEKLWEKAHKGAAILDIAVHSSGKLALTLGSDCTIRTWNLVKGRAAYIINLNSKCQDPKSLERIIFAPDDVRFALYGGKYTEIWSIEAGGVLKVIKHEEKVTGCVWLGNDKICVGYEDGKITIWDIDSQKEKHSQQAHTGRVKAVQCFQGYIVTASSTGQIKVWTKKLKQVSSIETDCRITCLCIAQWNGVVKKEEPQEIVDDVVIEENNVKKSTVVVEIDESSDEEVQSGKKRKNKKYVDPSQMKIKKNQSVDIDLSQEVREKHLIKRTKKIKKKKNKIGIS